MANDQSGAGAGATGTASDPMAQMVAARRAALTGDLARRTGDGRWGLALSGGGIRSATFCFGLLKALAQHKVLHRFDFLSTVSGGGYIGAMLGKLYQDADAAEVEAAMGSADERWFAFWLRANGRYLIPHGLRDIVFAAANFGRNLFGVHLEIAFLSVLLGGFLAGFDLFAWHAAESVGNPAPGSGQGGIGPGPGLMPLVSAWPALWMLLPPVLFAGAIAAAAYWCLPEGAQRRLPAFRWIAAGGCVLFAGAIGWHLVGASRADEGLAQGSVAASTIVLAIAAAALLAAAAGTLVAQALCLMPRMSPELARNRLTATLAATLQAMLAIVVLGLMDLVAWRFAVSLASPGRAASAIALAIVLLRAVLPHIGDLPRGLPPLARTAVAELMNLAGLAALASLVIFWIGIVHRSVTLALFDVNAGLVWGQSLLWFAVVVVPPAAFVLISRGNRAFLNRSSLFAFYRARLVRSYLGATNPARFPAGAHGVIEPYPQTAAVDGPIASVREVKDGDDLALGDYAPHRRGGPVHLVNVCINQTQDVRRGLFNADRKGLSMTIAPRGHVCVGQEDWRLLDGDARLSVGAWMAISGAAVAPGLGATTRPGLAALLTLAGIRLGYWWDSAGIQGRGDVRPAVGKYGQLLGELRGAFAGTARRDWYLSDGGHFENTAAYALLREECELIVVADCGADPRYAFADLENLVRKARIDLQAEITFLRPASRHASDPANPPRVFGSLNDLASADSHACLTLARVDYRRTGKSGHLVVVKPNMCAGAPVDLVNFKADNRLFPQEPTTDQFFSEAQWESYFQLGTLLGGHLRPGFLDDIAANAGLWFQNDDGSVATPVEDRSRSKAEPKRIPSRIAATGAVTASLSLGALATMASSAWQVVDEQLQAMRNERRVDPALLRELSDAYAQLSPPTDATEPAAGGASGGVALGRIATSLARINEEVCDNSNKQAFQQNLLIRDMADTTLRLCAAATHKHPSCTRIASTHPLAGCMLPQTGFRCEPHYWIRGYGGDDPLLDNCRRPPGGLGAPVLRWDQVLDAALPGAGTALRRSVTRDLLPGAWFAGSVSAVLPAPPPPPQGVPDIRAPAGPAAPAPLRTAAAAPVQQVRVCDGKTIYVQIFGPDLRDTVAALRTPWQALGADVQPVEDVWETARRAARAAPRAPPQPTVLYHDDDSLACARRLGPPEPAAAWKVDPLPPRLVSPPGVIEVWLPPAMLPRVGQCYQEDAGAAANPRYGVYCFATRVQCERVRGPNAARVQTACQDVDLSTQDALLRQRGFGGSWYAQQATPFGAPFPPLPGAADPATGAP